ncbi:MAG TPA: cytochrome c [Candidatus Acidoferrum sp.]|jgi:cytochrome c oxidase cbb3-type subunit 2|nr:cytochrome c [Candidatus Acidoferrum sp.]
MKITKLAVALLAVCPFIVSAQQPQSEQGSAQPPTQPAPTQQAPPAEKAAAAPNRNAPQESHIGKVTGHSESGKQLFYRYCWGCHGFRGDGNGENWLPPGTWLEPYMNIQPRNFVAGTFKCRSTPTGTLPTDQDLYNSLVRGLVNSNMPSWITLTAQNRADLIAFIKTFSPRWQTEKSGDPINVPAEPALTLSSIKHGQELFQKLECWKCHGQEGRGDGPSASTLTDSNDQPIRPYNFTTGSRFKCGVTNRDLYKIFITGVDGTPMPSFADVVKPEEAWDLVHYLRTLQVTHKSPELTLWMSTPEGAAIVSAQKITGTPTGSGIKQ